MKLIAHFGPAFIVLAALLWGLDGILRRSLFSLPPIIIVFYEHLIGLILIAPFFLPLLKKEKLAKKEWGAVIWVSLLSGVLGTLWFTTALLKVNFISFSVVFLLQKLQPLFAIGAAALILKERINRKYVGWAVLAIIAAYFMTFKSGIVNFDTGKGTAIAALFALGAAFAWGTSTAISRFALIRHSNTLITGFRFALTTLFSFGLVFVLSQQSNFTAPEIGQFGRLLIIALTTGMVALWIYYRGLKTTEVKISTILELTFPLTAVFIDIYLYDTILAPSQYLAAAVLVFAMYNISRLHRQTSWSTQQLS